MRWRPIGFVLFGAVLIWCLGILLQVDSGPSLDVSTPESLPPNLTSGPRGTPEADPPVPVEPDALWTEADRRFAEKYERVVHQIADCGLDVVYRCYPDGCSSAVHEPTHAWDRAVAVFKARRLVAESIVHRTFDLPTDILPCARAFRELPSNSADRRSISGMLPTTTGTVYCLTRTKSEALEGESLAGFGEVHDQRCEELARDLGVTSSTTFAQVRKTGVIMRDEGGGP